LVSVSMFF